MKKNSTFTLRSGNKPSIAKLSGISPVKFEKDPEKFLQRIQKNPAIGPIDRVLGKGKKVTTKKDKKISDKSKQQRIVEGFVSPKARDLFTPEDRPKS